MCKGSVLGNEKGSSARHMGHSHRGACHCGVLRAAYVGGEHIVARCCHVYGGISIVAARPAVCSFIIPPREAFMSQCSRTSNAVHHIPIDNNRASLK